jgi:Flp pilus assembly protein TadD
MAFFSTLAIWLVVGAHAAGRLSAVTLMGVFLATFAALLCKEHAVVLVVVLPGFWLACRSLPAWDPPGNAQRTVVVDAAKIFACACLALAVCLAMRYAALGTWVPKPQGFGIAAVDHLLVFLRTIGKITTLTIFPFTQVGPVHPLPRDLRSIDEFLTAGVLAIAIGTIGIAWLWRKQRALFWIAVAFVASLAPIAQIRQLPIGENYIQDRFLTQPLAIACIFLALALGHVKWTRQRGERGAALVSVLVCTFFFLASVANVQVTLPFWKTDDALWALARERAPNSPTVLNAVAGNLLGAGKVEEAYALSMRAMAAWPENQNIAITNAMIHAEKGELATARKILDYLYLRDDVNNRVRLNLADTLLRLGELQDAGYLLDEIATANPKDWNLAILRAELHFRNNEPERAHAHLREFFKGSPPVELDNALKKLKKRGVEID